MNPSQTTERSGLVPAALLVMLVGTTLALLPAVRDEVTLPKATVLWTAGLALAALAGIAAVTRRAAAVPVGPPTVAAAVFAVVLVVATVTSALPLRSVVGTYGRYAGLASYAAYLIAFLTVLQCAAVPFFRRLAKIVVVVLAVVVAYGLLQAAGVDPLVEDQSRLTLGTTYSFFGNVNFGAAWAAMALPLSLALLVDRQERAAWRIAGGALLPLGLLYVALTRTSQGLVVAAVALGFCGVVVVTGDPTVRERLAARRSLVAGVTAALVVAIGAGTALGLPALRGQLEQSLVERPYFWRAALAIFRDHPALGTGLDTFGEFFLRYRSPEHAALVGRDTADHPHSIPLAMLSNGGLFLAAAYLAVTLLVAWALVRAVRHCRAEQRLVVAGFGGTWLGYQTQSLVSLDVPPLTLLGWVSGGVVVALGWPPRWVTVGRRPAADQGPKRGRAAVVPPVTAGTRAAQGVVVVVALVLGWLAWTPLRADFWADRALDGSGGVAEAAVARLDRAQAAYSSEPLYSFLQAEVYDDIGQHELALRSSAAAAQRSPGSASYALFSARQAQRLQDQATALRWLREAVERDPHAPPVLAEAGQGLLQGGHVAEALALLEHAVEVKADVRSLVLLAQAHVLQGHDPGTARQLLERALILQPGEPNATRLLQSLDGAS